MAGAGGGGGVREEAERWSSEVGAVEEDVGISERNKSGVQWQL